jgi:hypothetical protein
MKPVRRVRRVRHDERCRGAYAHPWQTGRRPKRPSVRRGGYGGREERDTEPNCPPLAYPGMHFWSVVADGRPAVEAAPSILLRDPGTARVVHYRAPLPLARAWLAATARAKAPVTARGAAAAAPADALVMRTAAALRRRSHRLALRGDRADRNRGEQCCNESSNHVDLPGDFRPIEQAHQSWRPPSTRQGPSQVDVVRPKTRKCANADERSEEGQFKTWPAPLEIAHKARQEPMWAGGLLFLSSAGAETENRQWL